LFFLGLCLEGMRKVIMIAGLWFKLKLEKHETSYMWCGVGCSPVTVDCVSEVLSPDLYRLIISSDNCHWSISSHNTQNTELWCTMSNVFARWHVSVSRRNIFPTPSLHNVSNTNCNMWTQTHSKPEEQQLLHWLSSCKTIWVKNRCEL
jgi:hypothetical protein